MPQRNTARPGGRAVAGAALPAALKVYIAVVCAFALVVLIGAVSTRESVEPRSLITLMLLALLASTIKVEIAIPGNASTLTACHVIDLIALASYGTNTAVVVGAWGAWTQCTIRNRTPNAPHKTLFSVASLAVTMWVAGNVLAWMSAHRPRAGGGPPWEMLAAAATISFIVNSGLVAAALAMASRRGMFTLWFEFFPTWPSYVIGAVLAGAIIDGVRHQTYWLAPLLATALALIHRSHQSVAERINESITDPLTGLYNQRFVSAHVEREIAHARRARSRVAVAVVDVDDFKMINDGLGHAVGDRALRRVADVLRQAVRDYDVCARYGGDEFVIVMSGCGEAEAARRIEEAKRSIEAGADDAVHRPVPVRISAGIAVFPDDGDRFEALFAAADSRMYACKQRRGISGTEPA